MDQEILPPQSTELSLTPASQILYTALAEEQIDLTKKGIAMLKETYLPLTIANYEDKAGYEIVRKARIDIKTRLVKLEKARKKGKSITHAYCEHIDEKAKYIEDELVSIREHLEKQEKQWEKEDAERKELERQKVAARVARIFATGPVSFDGTLIYRLSFDNNGVLEETRISASEIQRGSDEWFELTLKDFERIGGMIKAKAQQEEERKVAEQLEARKRVEEEQARLKQEREELARREEEVRQKEAVIAMQTPAPPTPPPAPTPQKSLPIQEPTINNAISEQTMLDQDKERLLLVASNFPKLVLPDVQHTVSKQIITFIQQSLKELSDQVIARVQKL